ncbi:DUF4402 domain-containing protein [Kaarinaea lacus]
MFNRKLLTTLVATAAIAASGYAANALAATATGASDAVILVPLSIAHNAGASLDFGTIAPDTGGATVQVTTAGVASVTAGSAVLSGATSADSFTVTGEGGMSYGITLPATITLTSGLNSMTVNNVVSSPATTGTLPAGAGAQVQTLTIGGDLVVGVAQAAGTYAGTYTVTVNYQ